MNAVPELVIFDCDGVLVDSEPIADRVLAAMLSSAGFPITAEECELRFTGLRYRTVFAEIEAEFGRPLPARFMEAVHRATLAAFTRELRPIAGIANAVAAVRGPKCVASSSAPIWIEHALTVTGLIGHFAPHLFSAVLVERGKPFPDLFLLAADRMGAAPAGCLVIEDSVAGVTAACAAGMRVLGFAGGGHARRAGYRERLLAAGAETVFDDMFALAARL